VAAPGNKRRLIVSTLIHLLLLRLRAHSKGFERTAVLGKIWKIVYVQLVKRRERNRKRGGYHHPSQRYIDAPAKTEIN